MGIAVEAISTDDFAAEAGVSIRTIQTWAKAGYFGKQSFNSYDLIGFLAGKTSLSTQAKTS
jgi:hypothetical protein